MKINYGKISFVMAGFNFLLLFFVPLFLDIVYREDKSELFSTSVIGIGRDFEPQKFFESPAFIAHIIYFCLAFLSALGLSCGINGLVRKTNKFYSIVGIVINSVILFSISSQLGVFSRFAFGLY